MKKADYAARLDAANAARSADAMFAVLDRLLMDLPCGLSPEMMGHVEMIDAVVQAGKVFAGQARQYLDGE